MQPYMGFAGSQELVPWQWELCHPHAVWEDTHTNQNEVETGHSKSMELPLVFDSLDSLVSLQNCDITPHSSTEHWESLYQCCSHSKSLLSIKQTHAWISKPTVLTWTNFKVFQPFLSRLTKGRHRQYL